MLKEVEIEISDQDLCHDLYNDVGLVVLPGQLCAGVVIGSCNVHRPIK
jgi:hypothetical protein